MAGSRVWTSPVPRSRYQIVPSGANVNADGPFRPVLTATAVMTARCAGAADTAAGVAPPAIDAATSAATTSPLIRCIGAPLKLAVAR